ncbi:MAG TPA: DUF4760 domain-containing protein [Xanthomonadaceae bacterium]|nr:DUF4760 domain-containing protein [Xanthomonadaceae bacterium]
MDLGTLAELTSAGAVVIGLLFAVVQLRQFRRIQEREAGLALLRSYQTRTFARALLIVFDLPAGLSKADVEARVGAEIATLYALMTTWESLGILVQRGQVDLAMVDDFFSGPILLTWQKLHPYVDEQRGQLQRDTIWEWFQWLAERMLEREAATPPVPAHIAHRHWIAGHRGR